MADHEPGTLPILAVRFAVSPPRDRCAQGSAIVGAAEDAPPPRVPTVSSASALVIPAGGQEVSVMTSVLTSHDLDASEPGVPPRGSNVDPLPALLRRIAASADGGAARRSMAMAVEYQR